MEEETVPPDLQTDHNGEGGKPEEGNGVALEENFEALYTPSDVSSSDDEEEETTIFDAKVHNGQEDESEPNMPTEADENYQLRESKQLSSEQEDAAQELTSSHGQKEQPFHEIAKELEQKCFSQQELIERLQEQLDSERERSQSKMADLEKELTLRVDQVTTLYEDVTREKEGLVDKVTLLEEERKKLVDQITAAEQKDRDALKERERLQGVVKKQKGEISKLQATCEKSEAKCGDHNQEVGKLKEEIGSLNIKVKWAQNKLKSETEAHRETKSQLSVTTKRLKEAREEGEQIRADLKTMITQYQESEEMRSNSLGVQLKKTEKELKQHEQEIADQQQLHDLTVKELELVKVSHTIAQEECQQLKTRIGDLNARVSEQTTEIEELKAVIARQKQDQKKLTTEMSGLEQLTQGIESERSKFSTLRDSHAQLQKSHQHLEREVARRKAREEELLAFSEKLSSVSAELQAEKSSWDNKVSSLTVERDRLSASLAEVQSERQSQMEELSHLRAESQAQTTELVQKVEDKSKAVEELSMSLEDEREQIKALRKKNASNIKDLQKQLQQCKRRIEQLETTNAIEREPPPTLPVNENSRASSPNSLDGIGPTAISVNNTGLHHHHHHQQQGATAEITAHEDESVPSSPSPELFQTLDQEKLLLVEKLCKLKRQIAKLEEKTEFFEEHSLQLTEDIKKKSKIIQNFILREQVGALVPPSYDEHKARHSKRGGVMATVFSGLHPRGPNMSLDLSLEMNRKMQSVLEDTLLKNITLKENIDTLGKEIQRLSAQLQSYESSNR